jgi:hypothetical protein
MIKIWENGEERWISAEEIYIPFFARDTAPLVQEVEK